MRKLLVLGLATAAGYAAARALMEHELPEATPQPVREHLEHHRTQLQRVRARAREVFIAARKASDEAAHELLADYERRAGRTTTTRTASARASWRR